MDGTMNVVIVDLDMARWMGVWTNGMAVCGWFQPWVMRWMDGWCMSGINSWIDGWANMDGSVGGGCVSGVVSGWMVDGCMNRT